MEVGEIITETVDQVEQYGVFLSHDSGRLFIQLPELDWVLRISDPREFTSPGDTFEALVLGYNESKNLFYGSIKAAHPELDPYKYGPIYEVGTKHKGKVFKNTDYGTFVEIAPGLEALIYNELGGNFTIGANLEVSVVLYDIEKRRMQVEVST